MKKDQKTIQSVLTLAVSRTFVNMTRRFAFPFLPEISRNLGVPLVSVQSAVSTQGGVGVTAPLFGPLIERFGRKRIMLAATAVISVASVPGILAPRSFGVFYAVIVIWGLSKWAFDPAMMAYVADRVSYARRGLAMGTTELSWAASLAIAAPLTGYLLGVNGLRPVYAMIFPILNALAFVMIAFFTLPDAPTREARQHASLLRSWGVLVNHPAALAALAYTVCLIVATEIVLITYGGWMESTFDLELAALGTVTIVIAAAEVTGEFVVIGAADRIGKRNLALIGTLVSALGYLALTQLGGSLVWAQAGLFVIFVSVETAIVASLPLFSEVLPDARAVMMSATVASHALARFGGGILGSQAYRLADFTVAGVLAMSIGLLAFVIMWRFIADHDASSSTITSD